MTKTKIADLSELNDREPTYALVANVDLVVIRYDNEVSVLYGRCHHRGALLADGYIDGENLICGVHYWDYRYDTGISEYHTGAAPLLFRDNISVPTMPALARARKYLDETGNRDVTLIITGGLRIPADFAKALALGADGVAIANSAMQAIGCIGMRACHTNNCPVGIATQKEHLRSRLKVEASAQRLNRFLGASVSLMQVLARACGHTHLNQFNSDDLTTWARDIAYLTGVKYAGVVPL